MKYTFIKEWSGYDTLVIEADSLEEAEEIIDQRRYNKESIEEGLKISLSDWEEK